MPSLSEFPKAAVITRICCLPVEFHRHSHQTVKASRAGFHHQAKLRRFCRLPNCFVPGLLVFSSLHNCPLFNESYAASYIKKKKKLTTPLAPKLSHCSSVSLSQCFYHLLTCYIIYLFLCLLFIFCLSWLLQRRKDLGGFVCFYLFGLIWFQVPKIAPDTQNSVFLDWMKKCISCNMTWHAWETWRF